MIDTHCHIDFEAFDEDREETLKRAFDAGTEYIIVPAVEPKNYEKIAELVKNEPRLYRASGLHPHNAKEADDKLFEKIDEICRQKKTVAVGEIGLDYYYDFAPKDVQKTVFIEQLRIAKKNDLPAIIHNREADDDLLEILEKEQDGSLKGALHCFSAPLETMEKALDLGFWISFTGIVTFKNSGLTEVVKKAPLDKIMIETDAPFLAPVPKRGKRNEPAFVRYVAEKIAQIKNIPINEILDMTTKNAKRFFKLATLAAAFLLSFYSAFAQNDEYDDEEIAQEEFVHPYPKFIGFGPMFGANTAVETNYLPNNTEPNISYDGLPAFGFAVCYGATDHIVLELAYNYSKNEKIAKDWDYTIKPSVYQNFEFSSNFILNPYSRINFYGTLGLTFMANSFNDVPDKQIGYNGGIGMYINVQTGYGLLAFSGEWKINFETKKKKQRYKSRVYPDGITVDTKSLYSIPRLTIFFFPDF